MELKEKLVECFKDTLHIINSNEKLLATTKAAVKNTNYFTPLVDNMLRNENREKAVVTVIEDTSFHAAQQLAKQGCKVAVLNFASAVNPGGGVTAGAMAQEECLCRSSNLLPCLKQKKLMQDYYMPNRITNNPMYNDNLIYSEGVTVFKTDDTIPVLMPENEWFKVDVITCAAPNLRNVQNFNEDKLYEIFTSRIHAILDRAYLQGIDSVVLGAFGCGAFKNPPEIVAKAFKSEIESEFSKVFKNIIFAIKKSSNNNFFVFERILGKENIKKITSISNEEFVDWRKNNSYFGKKFSILGDSISTLEGFIPKDYKAFFQGEICKKAGVLTPLETWWGQVISYFGGELLVNDSYSGSRVTSSSKSFPAGISQKRIDDLSKNGLSPDVIIVYLGFNDWANGVPVKAVQNTDKPISAYFDYSYFNMIIEISKKYPNAEIWCCTLNPTYMSTNPNFTFPNERNGVHIEKYNSIIRMASSANGRKLIDLFANGFHNDTIDGSHPNSEGMKTLAKSVCLSIVNDLSLIENDSFYAQPFEIRENIELCNNDEHCFVKHKELTGATEYKCSKCGLETVVHTLPKPFCYSEIKNYIGSKLDGETITENWFEKSVEKSTDISSGLETMPSESKTKESIKLVCSKCGNVLNPIDKFCMKCGTKTNFEKDGNSENDSPNNKEDVPEIIDNRYELIRQTGKGASSVVYLAQDKKLDRICAVKIVNKNTYANKIAAQESLNEANKMKLLAHISIPQLYDIFDDDDRLCIVMEFIEGKTLNEIIKSMTRPLDEYTIIQWSKQLCRVLFYLHTLKPPRIFRDLKPANIILQPNGVIKLIDFGTMKNYDDSRSEDTVNLGTKGYAAPEQFGGRGATDARTDIYGLGMTMYHLITGVNPSLPPFEFKPIRYYRKDVSKGLEDIVMKCIAIEREERYQSAIHILKDLERLG